MPVSPAMSRSHPTPPCASHADLPVESWAAAVGGGGAAVLSETRRPATRRCARLSSWMLSVVLCCGLGFGCGEIRQAPLDDEGSPPPSSETDGTLTDSDVELELHPSTLNPALGDTVEVTINVTPAGVHTVNVAILGDVDSAYLNHSMVKTAPDGTASVKLTVSKEPLTSLTLLASVDGAQAEATVNVQERQKTTLRVEPVYSGLRPVDEWSVGTVLDKTCAEIDLINATYAETFKASATFPGDQELAVYDPVVVRVSVRNYAILLRGDQYVYGCREAQLSATDQEQSVRIALTDRPLRLGSIDFGVRFGLESSAELTEIVSDIGERMLAAFTQGYATDLAALLGNMAQASGNEEAFLAAQTMEGWAEVLISSGVFAEAGAERGLSSRLQLWLTQGVVQLFSNDALRGRLVGSDGAAGNGLLEPVVMAGAPPERVGLPDQIAVTLDAEGDTLQLSTRLLWQTSRLLAGIAEQVAVTSTAETELESMSEALSVVVDCPRIGYVLAGDDGIGFEGCDAECLAVACEQAFVAMWDAVVVADPSIASLNLSAAGPTDFDRAARPLGFSGTWVGEAELGRELPVPVRGTFAAGEVLDAEEQAETAEQ